MYELLSIDKGDATRFLKLKNKNSGVIEECFDDSSVVSKNDFSFMEIGKVYNCKIKLFGRLSTDTTEKSMCCKVLNNDVIVGDKILVRVLSQNCEYYIPKQKVGNFKFGQVFKFYSTRKDLIQVDNCIHPDFLKT